MEPLNEQTVTKMFTNLITGKMTQADLQVMTEVINTFKDQAPVLVTETEKKPIEPSSDGPSGETNEAKMIDQILLFLKDRKPQPSHEIAKAMDMGGENENLVRIRPILEGMAEEGLIFHMIERDGEEVSLWELPFENLEIKKNKNGKLEAHIDGEKAPDLVQKIKRKKYNLSKLSVKEEILQILRTENRPLTVKEILGLTVGRNSASIYTVLWQLKRDQEISHDKQNKTYKLWNQEKFSTENTEITISKDEMGDPGELIVDANFPRKTVISILRHAGKPLTQASIVVRSSGVPPVKIKQAITALEQEKKIKISMGKLALNPILI